MLTLGLGLGLKTEFFGLGLGLAFFGLDLCGLVNITEQAYSQYAKSNLMIPTLKTL